MALRVAVIGAGAAGLAALRHLSAQPKLFSPMAFEQTASLGGTWVYTEQIGVDAKGLPIHASMYTNLRTNLPKEIMAYPDYPFQSDLPSFVTHEEVLQYLEDYASNFNLADYIQFDTVVESVVPVRQDDKTSWKVQCRRVASSEVNQHEFDAVMVCNGHYSIPLIPDLPGLKEFKGKVMHSHDYRHPEAFSNRKVALLGAASSGQDIALDIATFAEKVTLCHRKQPLKSKLPDNVIQASGIREVKADSVVLESGGEVEIDSLLFCTGYRYTFPFLSEDCCPTIVDERVQPLYKHIIHTAFPSLSFIGICKVICPFPQFHSQVLFVLAALTGSMVLPSREEMDSDIARDYEWRIGDGMPPRYAHTLGPLQWDYNDMLAELAGFTPIPRVVHTLYDYVHERRTYELMVYKMQQYELISGEEYRVVN